MDKIIKTLGILAFLSLCGAFGAGFVLQDMQLFGYGVGLFFIFIGLFGASILWTL